MNKILFFLAKEIIKKYLPKPIESSGNDQYTIGWNDCLQITKKKLGIKNG